MGLPPLGPSLGRLVRRAKRDLTPLVEAFRKLGIKAKVKADAVVLPQILLVASAVWDDYFWRPDGMGPVLAQYPMGEEWSGWIVRVRDLGGEHFHDVEDPYMEASDDPLIYIRFPPNAYEPEEVEELHELIGDLQDGAGFSLEEGGVHFAGGGGPLLPEEER